VFTETDDESHALEQTLNIITDSKYVMKQIIRKVAKGILGDEGVRQVKRIIGK